MNPVRVHIEKTYFALSIVAIKWDEGEYEHTAKVLNADSQEAAVEKGYTWGREHWPEAEGWELAVAANRLTFKPPSDHTPR